MLPEEAPDYDWNATTDFGGSLMQYRYDIFMPKGILGNLWLGDGPGEIGDNLPPIKL